MEDKLHYYRAKVYNVVDGDTFDALVDYGFHGSLKLRFRAYMDDGTYFDTPETRLYRGVTEEQKEHGLEAKARAVELLLDRDDVIIKTYKEGSFRWLAEFYYKEDGEWKNYQQVMIAEGFQKKDNYNDEIS